MIPDSGPISQEKELTDSEMAPYSHLTMVFFNKGKLALVDLLETQYFCLCQGVLQKNPQDNLDCLLTLEGGTPLDCNSYFC